MAIWSQHGKLSEAGPCEEEFRHNVAVTWPHSRGPPLREFQPQERRIRWYRAATWSARLIRTLQTGHDTTGLGEAMRRKRGIVGEPYIPQVSGGAGPKSSIDDRRACGVLRLLCGTMW